MSRECAACGSKRVTIQDKLHTFTYGNKRFNDEIEIDLTAVIPVHSCDKCELDLIDWKAQKILDRAVKRYLKKGKTFYRPIKIWSLIVLLFSIAFILCSVGWLFISFCF